MWVMGRDSSMLVDMGTCRGALQGSEGSSRGGFRSAGLSLSSVLLGRFGDKHCAGGRDSETAGATGAPTGGASSEAPANSETNGKDMKKKFNYGRYEIMSVAEMSHACSLTMFISHVPN